MSHVSDYNAVVEPTLCGGICSGGFRFHHSVLDGFSFLVIGTSTSTQVGFWLVFVGFFLSSWRHGSFGLRDADHASLHSAL